MTRSVNNPSPGLICTYFELDQVQRLLDLGYLNLSQQFSENDNNRYKITI